MVSNLRKSRYCSKLPWYFYNTGQNIPRYFNARRRRYHGKLLRYCFITLAPGQPARGVNYSEKCFMKSATARWRRKKFYKISTRWGARFSSPPSSWSRRTIRNVQTFCWKSNKLVRFKATLTILLRSKTCLPSCFFGTPKVGLMSD
jgi:hypothetical protein